MGNMTFTEAQDFRNIQARLTRFRREHTAELTLEDIRLISDIVGDVTLLLKRYSAGTLPGGI